MFDEDDQISIHASRARRLEEARIAWLNRLREKNSAANAAKLLGLEAATYRAYERGPGPSKFIPINYDLAARIAGMMGINRDWLLDGTGEMGLVARPAKPGISEAPKMEAVSVQKAREVPVVGQVQAGAYMYVQDFDHFDGDTEYVPFSDPRYQRATVYALKVVGDSCNLKYPDRTTIYYVPVPEMFPRELQFVVVRCFDGAGKAETTVKQIVREGSLIRLCPRSSNPKYRPIEYDRAVLRDEANQDGPQIIGVVIGSYTPDDGEAGEFIF